MNIDEIILLDVNRVIQSPDLLKVVLVSYKELFNIKDNQINASCERCLRDYYNQVKIRIMSKDKTVKKFKLINDGAGNSIRIRLAFGSSDFYVNDNLTEAVALEYLSKNPNRINQFQEFPEDWESRIEGGSDELSSMTVKELKAFAETNEIKLTETKKADILKEIREALTVKLEVTSEETAEEEEE